MFSDSELRLVFPSSCSVISISILFIYMIIGFILYTKPYIQWSEFHSSSLDDLNIMMPIK